MKMASSHVGDDAKLYFKWQSQVQITLYLVEQTSHKRGISRAYCAQA
jgi:hypothetical protein